MKSKKLNVLMIAIMVAFVFALAGCETNTSQDESNSSQLSTAENVAQSSNPDSKSPEESATKSDASIQRVEDGSITFRGIPWYCTKAEAERIITEDGGKGGSSPSNDLYRMSATDYSNTTMGSDRVDEGGINRYYSGLSVAGYSVDAYVCYMYPIEGGRILTSDEDALFYFGWYSFDSDFGDHAAIYEDLKGKLVGLYGEGISSETEYLTTMTWKDKDSNQVRLLINANKNYVTLGYMATGADEKLDEVETAVSNTAADKEQAVREDNVSNTSGL